MKLPRDISGKDLAKLLRPYGYEVTRQSGSHMRLSSTLKDHVHHLTIPAHASLRVGTLSSILADVALYLERDRADLMTELFPR